MATSTTILTDQDKKILRYAAYGIGGLAVSGGLFLLVRKMIRSGITNRIELETIDEGAPATFAKQFKMAFENNGWPGTNEALVRRLFIDVPTKAFFAQVIKKYQQLYRDNLMQKLSDELSDTEYQEMLSIYSPKPDRIVGSTPTYDPFAWAKRLKAAFDLVIWGIPQTDEDAVRAVLNEIPDANQWGEVKNAYRTLYARELVADLKSELQWWEQEEILSLVKNKFQTL